MNMKKKECKRLKKRQYLSRPAYILIWCGLPPILFCLVGLLHLVGEAAPLTRADAAYYGKLLEYPMAALAIATAGTLLVDYAYKKDTYK